MPGLQTLALGAGAQEGLEQLLARRLAQAKFEEEQRQAQAEEAHRTKALEEQSRLREATLAGTEAYRTGQLEQTSVLRGIQQQQADTAERRATDLAQQAEARRLDMEARQIMQNAINEARLEIQRGNLEVSRANQLINQLQLELARVREERIAKMSRPEEAAARVGAETRARLKAKEETEWNPLEDLLKGFIGRFKTRPPADDDDITIEREP